MRRCCRHSCGVCVFWSEYVCRFVGLPACCWLSVRVCVFLAIFTLSVDVFVVAVIAVIVVAVVVAVVPAMFFFHKSIIFAIFPSYLFIIKHRIIFFSFVWFFSFHFFFCFINWLTYSLSVAGWLAVSSCKILGILFFAFFLIFFSFVFSLDGYGWCFNFHKQWVRKNNFY